MEEVTIDVDPVSNTDTIQIEGCPEKTVATITGECSNTPIDISQDDNLAVTKSAHIRSTKIDSRCLSSKKGRKMFRRPAKKIIKYNERQRRVDEAYAVMKTLENEQHRDRFSIFGEHVACKMRMLRTENAQNMVEHLICHTLWEASLGKYDKPMFIPSNLPSFWQSSPSSMNSPNV